MTRQDTLEDRRAEALWLRLPQDDQHFSRTVWDQFRSEAFRLPLADLERHAHVSIDNRHKCRNCFTCACAAELMKRRSTT